jgi:hypothetical protein
LREKSRVAAARIAFRLDICYLLIKTDRMIGRFFN